VVRKTWEALAGGDVKTVFANITDDVTWTVPGMLPGISGTKRGRDEIMEFLRGVTRNFPGGLRSEIRKVHVAGDAVILEMTNRGTAANGRPYENEYCFVFEVEGGKVRRIREYVDTQRAAAVFGA
jgi:hypothetical protein